MRLEDPVFAPLSEARARYLREDFRQGFPAFCGFRVERVAAGEFWTAAVVRPEHCQQDGFVHAGVLATLADHTAGYAAYTLVPEDRRILTVEFKVNFLRPARGEELGCRARVIHAGRTLLVAESDVSAAHGGTECRVARATVTLASVAATRIASGPPGRA